MGMLGEIDPSKVAQLEYTHPTALAWTTLKYQTVSPRDAAIGEQGISYRSGILSREKCAKVSMS
jgi:hypothetical protein